MAHEWRHFLQYNRPALKKKFILGNKRKELDARKYEKKIIKKWLDTQSPTIHSVGDTS